MRSYGFIRRLDRLGRLVVPIDLRRRLNLQEGDAVEFLPAGEQGGFFVKRYRPDIPKSDPAMQGR